MLTFRARRDASTIAPCNRSGVAATERRTEATLRRHPALNVIREEWRRPVVGAGSGGGG
jgi:hypothetical protein